MLEKFIFPLRPDETNTKWYLVFAALLFILGSRGGTTPMSEGPLKSRRQDHEPPLAIEQMGWRYHHIGIPTTSPRLGERYIEHLKIYVEGFENSPYGIEWMRFESDCPISKLIRTVPHIAFEVEDLDAAIEGKTLLGEISSPSKEVRVAMIVDDGAPVELIEFRKAADSEKSDMD